MEERQYWANEAYWIDALAAYQAHREAGCKHVTIDLEAVEKVVFDGDGPAYRLLYAMESVIKHEGEEGFRGAPRLLLATLLCLHEISTRSSDQ